MKNLMKVVLMVVFIVGSYVQATSLSDSELYFDPGSIEFGQYPIIDLSMEDPNDQYTWDASGDPITDADILPTLKAGTYVRGQDFDPNDYYLIPNVDYYGDLDVPDTGDFTATFNVSGQYMVRITRQGGSEEVYAVLFETSFLGIDDGAPKDTGPTKKIDGPEGDVIIVAEGDDTLDKAAENIEGETDANGDPKNVERADGVDETVDKIKEEFEAGGGVDKIHVELVGHGAPGAISMNDKSTEDGDLIGPDEADILEFQKRIDPYVDHLSLFSCKSAKGEKGEKLLEILASSLGRASGWSVTISVGDGGFYVPIFAEPNVVDCYWQTVRDNAVVVLYTITGLMNPSEEIAAINENWDEYYGLRTEPTGQLKMDNDSIVFEYSPSEIGTPSILLTYSVVDPNTGHEVDLWEGMDKVEYYSVDVVDIPENLGELMYDHPNSMTYAAFHDRIRDEWVKIEESSDSGSNFEVVYTMSEDEYEPIIIAFPLDADGHEITDVGAVAFGSTVDVTTPCPYAIDGDINGDCRVDFSDLTIMASHWLEDSTVGIP